MWKPFKVGRLEGEETQRGSVRGEIHAPTANPAAPAPVYWNVIDFKRRGDCLVASGYAATTDAAKAACLAAMGS